MHTPSTPLAGREPHWGSAPRGTLAATTPRHRAFTLIELLVVTAILAVALGAIAASLSAGIRAWEAAQTFSAGEGDALMALRIARRDLMNAPRFAGITFTGDAYGFTTAARLRDPDTGERRLGSVRYAYEPSGGVLRRLVWAYGESEPSLTGGEALARALQSLRVSYLAAPDGEWATDWTGRTNDPVAVRIEAWTGARRTRLQETVVTPRAAGEGAQAK